jgi:hypothetical protein
MNFFKTSIFSQLFILVLIFSACKRNQSITQTNFSGHEPKIYALSKGFSNPLNDHSEGFYATQLMLSSDGVLFNQLKTTVSDNSDIILFRIFTPDLNEIPAGTYTYDHRNSHLNTFNYGDTYEEFEADKESKQIEALTVTEGKIKIEKIGSIYHISMRVNATDKAGNVTQINREYKGAIQKADFNL